MDNDVHILKQLGFSLDEKQPHLGGERRVFATGKSVLFGTRDSDNIRVVIKISHDRLGIQEIERERTCREALDAIRFAYGAFSSPTEVLFTKKDNYAVQVTRFIEQDTTLLARTTPEQFRFTLKGLKTMEAAHATTYSHLRSVSGIFPRMDADDYIRSFTDFERYICDKFPEFRTIVSRAMQELKARHDDIERYCGFLTHFDFTPQNIRIKDDTMYLLDHSSLRFGSKHESWARFINFMVLYNIELSNSLVQYMHLNRAPEEAASLRLMRVFRLGELIAHHVRVAAATKGDLHKLSTTRVAFWNDVLTSVLDDVSVPEGLIATKNLGERVNFQSYFSLDKIFSED